MVLTYTTDVSGNHVNNDKNQVNMPVVLQNHENHYNPDYHSLFNISQNHFLTDASLTEKRGCLFVYLLFICGRKINISDISVTYLISKQNSQFSNNTF